MKTIYKLFPYFFVKWFALRYCEILPSPEVTKKVYVFEGEAIEVRCKKK